MKEKALKKLLICPLGDRILIKPKKAEDKTSSGIIIPELAKEKPQEGEVLEVGPGADDEKMRIKPGDTVLFGKYSGTEINYEKEQYLIMKQSDLLAIIKVNQDDTNK